MQYRSIQNRSRAVRGGRLIRSHPDYGHIHGDDEHNELYTCASDTIADILHALNANGVFDHGTFSTFSPEALLDHALVAYVGDFEDEEDEEAET